ncbi:MAG: acetoacetate--CoA ligase [Gammaproteobacteria bacterium]
MRSDTPIWSPSAARTAQANMTRFMREVEAELTPEVKTYAALYHWSITEPQAFWGAVWKFCDIRSSAPWYAVLENGDRMPGARWFPGARLNFAENLLSRRDHKAALVFRGEDGSRRAITYEALAAQVRALSGALRGAGVGAGDRISACMPNLPETVVGMLAASSLGAVWSSCSPDFGVKGVLDRFGQIRPKVAFITDGYFYNGRWIAGGDKMRQVLAQLPGVEVVVEVPYGGGRGAGTSAPGIPYAEFLQRGRGEGLSFTQLPFDHPLYILYSSGTTGPPKCIVHGAGGTLIQHLKEQVLHTDLKPGDTIFYFTTCGWMMWNWLVSSLAVGATVVLYDGSPMHPKPEVLFDLVEQEGINVFGVSARYLAALEKAGVHPGKTHDMTTLRTILSTGSPLAPASFDYVYQHVKSDVQLSSISGGTDIVSCFALGNPVLPVYRGELQCRGLGMKVEIYDDGGQPIYEKHGELVCTAPFPSMPLGFWNDPSGERYREAYFARFPGAWTHGDYAELNIHGGVIIHGRSDAVLNPGGVRIGTAEIYRQVETLPEVVESLAIAQDWDNDQRILLFVRLRDEYRLDETLIDRIKKAIRENVSPRHVPAKVIPIADLPRTMNGKLAELAVREVIHGRGVKNRDALANPEALELFRDLPELRSA